MNNIEACDHGASAWEPSSWRGNSSSGVSLEGFHVRKELEGIDGAKDFPKLPFLSPLTPECSVK